MEDSERQPRSAGKASRRGARPARRGAEGVEGLLARRAAGLRRGLRVVPRAAVARHGPQRLLDFPMKILDFS